MQSLPQSRFLGQAAAIAPRLRLICSLMLSLRETVGRWRRDIRSTGMLAVRADRARQLRLVQAGSLISSRRRKASAGNTNRCRKMANREFFTER